MTDSVALPRVWGVIPAAGMSRRMGFPKQAADVGGSTMAALVVRTLLDAGVAGVVVVTRSELVDALALPETDRVSVAINDDAESEMIDSIRIGCTWLVESSTNFSKPFDVGAEAVEVPSKHDGVMVVPADMPRLSAANCRACVERFATNPNLIVIATYEGKRGHPIVFPMSLCDDATAMDGGLRMLPAAYPDRVVLLETGDAGSTLDVDTRSDFDRLEP